VANFLKSLFVKGVEIDTAGAITGDVLKYDGSKFGAASVGGSAVGELDDLTDVIITTPLEFQTLEYNGTNWVNANAPSSVYVRNAEATTLTTGTCVYLFGATGDHATVKRADNNSDTTSAKTVGVVSANIAASQNGVVVTQGYVDGIDLSTGYTAGDVLWLGEAGAFTTTKPTAPDHLVFIGVVVRATNNGIIYVATQNGYELDELHNVAINAGTLATGDVIRYNASTSLWENSQAVGPTGPTGATGPQGLGYVIGTAELAEQDPESGNWTFKVSSVGAFASGDYVRVKEDSSNYILGTCYAISFFSGSYYMSVAPDVTVGTPDFDPSFSVHLAGETGASGVTVVSDTAPVSPSSGNLWFKSDTGNLLIYYDSYWIDASAPNYATLDGGSA